MSLIGAISKDEPPPLTDVQPVMSPALDYLVRMCLAKHPDDRFQSAHDLRLQLEWLHQNGSAAGLPAPVAAHRARRAYLAWAASVVVALVIGAAATRLWLEPAPAAAPAVTRFEHVLPDGQNFTRPQRHALALSSDGTKLAYIANRQLYVREMNGLRAQPIRGTAEDPMEPVFSPDGTWLASFVPQSGAGTTGGVTLRKVAVTGGAPVTLAQVPGPAYGASWGGG